MSEHPERMQEAHKAEAAAQAQEDSAQADVQEPQPNMLPASGPAGAEDAPAPDEAAADAPNARREYMKRRWLKLLWRLAWPALMGLGFLLRWIYARDVFGFGRAYDVWIYPTISKGINFVFGWIPISWAEILLYVGIVGLLTSLVVLIVRLVKRPDKLFRAVRYLTTLGSIACALLFLFNFLWGFNYERVSVGELMGLDVRARDKAELTALCEGLLEDAVMYREEVLEDERGIFRYASGNMMMLERVPYAFQMLHREVGIFPQEYAKPKAVLASEGMCYLDIAGIFIPFTMEPNVNMYATPLYTAVSACHEYAHLQGIAREDEANFVAYLACMAIDNDEYRYSGTMLALNHAMGQLASADPDAYARLRMAYSEGMNRDIQDYAQHWAQYEGPVAEASSQMNNNYLRGQGQEDGVKSYGRMVDLLLAHRAG